MQTTTHAPSTLVWGLEELATGLHVIISQKLACIHLESPPQYATLTGKLRGQMVKLRTNRYLHNSGVLFTLATMHDENERTFSVTCSAVPPPRLNLPILGIDYVALAGKLSLCVCDLCPTDETAWQRYAVPPLQQLRRVFDRFGTARERPEFVGDTFSPLAVFASAPRGHEPILIQQALQLATAYAQWLPFSTFTWVSSNPAEQRRRISTWKATMQKNKKESQALRGIFGEQAESYLKNFLFAE